MEEERVIKFIWLIEKRFLVSECRDASGSFYFNFKNETKLHLTSRKVSKNDFRVGFTIIHTFLQ